MAEQDDIFGKIDALLEKRVGFGAREVREADDFPLLTEVVELKGAATFPPGLRQGERRQLPKQSLASDLPATPAILTEAQFERLLAHLDERLETLFREQEKRVEAAIRRALREISSRGGPNEPV